MGKAKTPYNPSNRVNLHVVTRGDLNKASSHHFDSGNTNNDTFNVYPNIKDIYNYGIIIYAIIITNIYKEYKISPEYIRKELYISKPYFTQKLRKITICENYIARLTLYLYMLPTIIAQISNYWLIRVLIRFFLVMILLSSIHHLPACRNSRHL